MATTNRPSKVRVSRSEEPPPPPPRPPEEDELELELLELELELELELDELLPGFVVGVVPEVTGGAQAVVPAMAGAEDVALTEPTMTSAQSTRPWSSVTVTRTVSVPDVGATTVAVDVFAPVMAGGLAGGATYSQAYPATERPQEAALPVAFRDTFCPGETLPGRETAAIGLSAATTEPKAFAMPEPQTAVVQRHCVS